MRCKKLAHLLFLRVPIYTLLLAIIMQRSFGAAPPLPQQIHALVDATQRETSFVAGVHLDRFYGPRAYAPAWDGGNSALAVSALALLGSAGNDGLSPADYRLDAPPANTAQFDVALTLALLRYLNDLHSGRLAAGLEPDKQSGPMNFDAAALLRAAVDAKDLKSAVDAAEPGLHIYRRLKISLALYRALAERPPPSLPTLHQRETIEPNQYHEGMSGLRLYLHAVGDLASRDPIDSDDRYTPALVAAVTAFQDRHGLLADGRLGPQTLAAMNVPASRRIRQIELSLERLRWLPALPAGPVIAINVPSFRLWAYRETHSGAPPELSMRIIVGKAAIHPTPLFVGQMRYLQFNPYWNVPASIVRAEILPALARDHTYLARHAMELVDQRGQARAFDGPAALAGLRRGTLRVRQLPGKQNALGEVKFALPNTMNIYLHSTPSRQLFQATRRDFSHGCIRVENAAALAAFVLADQPEWNSAAIAAAIQSGHTSTVPLRVPLPVVFFYGTALADHDGRTLFSADMYGLDDALEHALASRPLRSVRVRP